MLYLELRDSLTGLPHSLTTVRNDDYGRDLGLLKTNPLSLFPNLKHKKMEAYLTYPILNKIICAIVTFIGMITDTWRGKIYNWLTFPSIILGWCLCYYFNGWPGLGYSLVATLVGIAIYLPLAIIGAYGMGDVKLMGAVGSICGTVFVLNVFLYTSVLGFFHAIIVHFINYGPDALMRAFASIKSGSFKHNTIQKENTNELTKNKIKYNLGLDIFIGVLIACYHCFTW